jgi:G:T-mismatch repair DNA endonuclease (very short patch repair protein)
MQRDKRYNRELKQLGWRVLRLWESDIRADYSQAASKVVEAILSERKRR